MYISVRCSFYGGVDVVLVVDKHVLISTSWIVHEDKHSLLHSMPNPNSAWDLSKYYTLDNIYYSGNLTIL